MDQVLTYGIGAGMGITCAVFVLALYIFYYSQISYRELRESDRFLGAMMFLYILGVSADAITYMCSEGSQIMLFTVALIADTVIMQLVFAFAHLFLTTEFSVKRPVSKQISYVGFVLAGVNMLAWFISIWSGWYFTIGNGLYTIGPYYLISQLVPAALFVIDFCVIFDRRRDVGRGVFVTWVMYITLCCLGIAAYSFTQIPFQYLAVALSIVLIYARIGTSKSELLKRQESEIIQKQEMLALSQIKPHFLFNCLTTIQVLIKKRPDVAVEATRHFTNFLRGYIDAIDTPEDITFRRELYIIENYLYLEKLQFEDRLKLKMEIEEEMFMLPALSVQPLVENAVKHGILKKPEGGTISIHSYATDDEFVVEVADDGVGFELVEAPSDQDLYDAPSHIGMKSVSNRLKLLKHGSLEIRSVMGEGSTVIVHIPKSMTKVQEANDIQAEVQDKPKATVVFADE